MKNILRALSFLMLPLSVSAQSNKPLPQFWSTNGTVNAIQRVDNTIYIGGSFTRVGPVNPFGTGISIASGQVDQRFLKPNGLVRSVIADGAGGWYIGGDFTRIGDEERNRIARIRPDGSLHPWNPNVNGSVHTLALQNNVLYAGGAFNNIGGLQRNRIAALDINDGKVLSWNPNSENIVRSIAVRGNTVYAGGDFYTIGGQIRPFFAALDAGTGNATWDAKVNGPVLSIMPSETTIYLGGSFSQCGGASRNNLAALDSATGNVTSWNPGANGTVRTMVLANGNLIAGGDFKVIQGQSRGYLCQFDLANGGLTAWNPQANGPVNSLAAYGNMLCTGGNFTDIGPGRARKYLSMLDLSTGQASNWSPNPDASVLSVAFSGNHLYAGGNFGAFGEGLLRNNLAALDATSGMPISWDLSVNGPVNTIFKSPTTQQVFIGGSFSQIGPNTPNGSCINLTTGAADTNFVKPNGAVRAVLADGNGGWYIGGEFTSVGGQPRNRLARINNDGTLNIWNPNINGTVNALALYYNTLYVGGTFSSVGGKSRNNIAAINTQTAVPTDWNPNANGSIHTVITSVEGSSIYVGGEFNTIGGQPRTFLASLDSLNGLATPWRPNPNGPIKTLLRDGNNIYVGGSFNTISGEVRNNIAALNGNTGIASGWDPNANGEVLSLRTNGTVIYAGGTFSQIGGQARNYIAALSTVNGQSNAWNPNADSTVNSIDLMGNSVIAGGAFLRIGGQTRYRLAAIDASTGNANAWDPSASGNIFTLSLQGNKIYAGGSFTSIGGAIRNNIAAIDHTTGDVTAFNPNANGKVNSLTTDARNDGRDFLWVGGQFTQIGGQARNYIAKVSTTGTGLTTDWNPNANSYVFSIVKDSSRILACGSFQNIGGQTRNFIAALSSSTGLATSWNPNANWYVHNIVLGNKKIYAFGDFQHIGGGSLMNKLSVLDAETGTAKPWSSNYTSYHDSTLLVGAFHGSHMYYAGNKGIWTPINLRSLDTSSGIITSWEPRPDGSVKAMTIYQNTLYVGGDFTQIGSLPHSGFAAFSLCASAPEKPVITRDSSGNLTSSAPTGNQWFKDGIAITGANSQTFKPSTPGSYAVRTSTNDCHSPVSDAVSYCLPAPATPTSSNTSIQYCVGQSSAALNATAAAGSTILWYTTPTGGTGSNIAPTPNTSTPGNYTYFASSFNNGCESINRLQFSVIVKRTPTKPTITQQANGHLLSTDTIGHQWFKDGTIIAGATNRSYLPSGPGNYTVVVTIEGCSSPPSEAFNYIPTGLVNFGNGQFLRVWPNPAETHIRIAFNVYGTSHIRVILHDLNGRELWKKDRLISGEHIPTTRLATGTYLLSLKDTKGRLLHRERILIQQ